MLKLVFFSVLALSVPGMGSGCRKPEIGPGTLVVLTESRILTLDPIKATDAASQRALQLIHAGLTTGGPDLGPAPELAKSWRVSDGHRRFTFRLHPDLKFHDGTALTAEDVVRSLVEFKEKAPGGVTLAHVTRIHAPDRESVELRADVPQPFLASDIAAAKVYKTDKSGRIVPAGRFRVTEELPSELRLERFEGFPFPRDTSPRLARYIRLRLVRDELTRYQHLLRGDGNVIFNGLGTAKAARLAQADPERLEKFEWPGTTVSYLCFNFRDARLANPKVRQAIAHAIDVDTIVQNRLPGSAVPATGLLSPVHGSHYEPRVKRYAFDPPLARRLLDEAGYPQKRGGSRFQLTFKTTFDRVGNDIARLIAGMLKDVGIDVKIQVVESGTFFADLKAGNFQLFQARWVGVTNPSIYFRVFHSSQELNRGRYVSPAMDKLLERAMVEPDDGRRQALFSEVQKLAALELPYVNLWHWSNLLIGTSRIRKITEYKNGSYLTLSEIELE